MNVSTSRRPSNNRMFDGPLGFLMKKEEDYTDLDG